MLFLDRFKFQTNPSLVNSLRGTFTLARLATVQLWVFTLARYTLPRGYHFSTFFNEGRSEPKWVGSCEVATNKAVIGSKKGLKGLTGKTLQQQHFLVCFERWHSHFCHGQTPKSKSFCIWWLTTAISGNLTGILNQLN